MQTGKQVADEGLNEKGSKKLRYCDETRAEGSTLSDYLDVRMGAALESSLGDPGF